MLPANATPLNGSSYDSGSIFFVGTATVILRYAGFTILTDPNFLHQGDHVHLGYGLRSQRRTNPAIEIEELPPLDLVVLSHMHEDHFDRVAIEKLDKQVPIVSTPHAVKSLREKGFNKLQDLAPWQSLTVRKGDSALTITAMPGRHGPGLLAAALPPVMGSLLEFQEQGQTRFCLYITGDTLVIEELKEIPKRYPNIDIALLHLGGTKVFGVLLTMDAKQGLEALQIIAPKLAIPIHYNDYTVFKSPLEDFVAAVEAAGLESKVRYLNHGDTYTFEVAAASPM
ncbi:MBL fold metallo-hydrolase [Pseudanabaena sp. FACHB-2040]|uniref:MBL fold metallo-hydrolase n=1 Tax=Pseudanabaena sp. FACHB-2040 TaxID=2692859 RepID=UPI0016841EBD|nr:MBL fold metallo-hydrolase [Pseudanabaena sp. FACHB-2040]